MAALSAPATRLTRNVANKKFHDYVVGTSAKIYAGSLVAINTSTGRAVAASVATGRKALGLSEETVTGNTDGTVRCRVVWNVEAKITAVATALTKAYIGSNVAVKTDNDVTTLSDAGTTALRVRVGELVSLTGTDAWVSLRNYTQSDV
jgi:hypothetical protein